ncbi:hypothetical protein [Flavobacterium sp. LB1P62]|uniref:hypothetical protein n=1 Tax=unclassified Flavobacterium TaxID=196869 RepID=UPI003AB0A393
MKKTINIPKVNLVLLKKKTKNSFTGYPVYLPSENIHNKIQNKLILMQLMFQNRKTNW